MGADPSFAGVQGQNLRLRTMVAQGESGMITRDTQVEQIVRIPGIVSYFIQRGVSPVTCSGAFPQTLGRLLEIKKVPDPKVFIAELNAFLKQRDVAPEGSPD